MKAQKDTSKEVACIWDSSNIQWITIAVKKQKDLPHIFRRVNVVAAIKKTIEIATQKC